MAACARPRGAGTATTCAGASGKKVECGQAHFDALGVDYKVVVSHHAI